MKVQTTKEDMMKALRNALASKNPIPGKEPESVGSPFRLSEEDKVVNFAKQFTDQGGDLRYCASEEEIRHQLTEIQAHNGNAVIACCNENLAKYISMLGIADSFLANTEKDYTIGALLCEGLLAWDGSIVLSDLQGLGPALLALPPVTVVVAFTSQVTADWEELCARLQESYKRLPDNLWKITPHCNAMQQIRLHLILIEDL